MHHRFDTRTKIQLDVELRLKGSSLGRFQTRDIDAVGVFIEAPGTRLQLHDVIEIDFRLDPGGRRRHSQRGVVVRCAADGVALMFIAANAALFEALDNRLSGLYPFYSTLAS